MRRSQVELIGIEYNSIPIQEKHCVCQDGRFKKKFARTVATNTFWKSGNLSGPLDRAIVDHVQSKDLRKCRLVRNIFILLCCCCCCFLNFASMFDLNTQRSRPERNFGSNSRIRPLSCVSPIPSLQKCSLMREFHSFLDSNQ